MTTEDDRTVLRCWYDTIGGRAQATLLRWCRTVGYARHDGVSVDMRDPPKLAGEDIEYLPGVTTRIDGRDMTAAESDAAKRMLVQMAEDARDALRGGSTLVVILR